MRAVPRSVMSLAVCVALAACVSWRPVDVGALARGEVDLRGARVNVETSGGGRTIELHDVSGGRIRGRDLASGREVSAAIAAVRAMHTEVRNGAATAGIVLGGIVLLVGVIFLAGYNP